MRWLAAHRSARRLIGCPAGASIAAHRLPRSATLSEQSFDHVIVGAGSAGCVLAQRLVAAGRGVLLLEAGPADDDKFVHMPATFVRVSSQLNAVFGG